MRDENKGGNVFGIRNFRLVFFGALVSDLGAVLYSFAVSFYILEITGNNAFLQGLYLALCGAVLLIATPVGGVLGDRYSKAKIMYICDYIKGGTVLLTALGILCFPGARAQLAFLFAAGIVGNGVSGVFSPAAGALLPHIVPEDRLQQANAYVSAKSSLQSIVGVVLAGILYAALPIHTLLFAVGVCYVLSGVSETFIRYAHTGSGEKLTLRLALLDMRSGLRYIRGQRALMAMMAAILFVNFFMSPLGNNFIPYFIRTDVAGAESYLFDRFLTPELWSSVFSMLIGVSMLIGALILSARGQAEKCGYRTALRLCVTAALMISLTVSYWLLVDRGGGLNVFLVLFCAGGFAIGMIIAFVNVPLNTAIMRVVDRDKLSKVNSILNILSLGLTPFASILAGSVLQTLGSAWLLLICTLGFSAAALTMLLNPAVREI